MGCDLVGLCMQLSIETSSRRFGVCNRSSVRVYYQKDDVVVVAKASPGQDESANNRSEMSTKRVYLYDRRTFHTKARIFQHFTSPEHTSSFLPSRQSWIHVSLQMNSTLSLHEGSFETTAASKGQSDCTTHYCPTSRNSKLL